ncbi:hypothetical protein V5739_13600 [Salinimicrobium sp. TIG7-5_MAKvit]|uniref:hypothetical protein n=1 Tax=Salinimicrobium sp. TIG7-5_MAKvit TaxID=3121289 RepID=UPI003C6DD142
MNKIQVGFLMSYDYRLLKTSLPLVYSEADSIIIALDKDLRTWTGSKFQVEEQFFDWLDVFDTENKINIYRDNFFLPNISPMENEVRERKMLASKMGIGNWLIQVDSDEYFVNFKAFAEALRSRNKYLENPEKNRIQIAGYYINLYKYTGNGILYVSKPRNQKFATNYPDYVTGRNTKQRVIYVPHIVIHECLSRSEDEIKTKFSNWGHSHQVNGEIFLDKWRQIDETNYKQFGDLFYLEPEKWKRLDYVQGQSMNKVIENLKSRELKPSKTHLLSKNFGQWFKFLFK